MASLHDPLRLAARALLSSSLALVLLAGCGGDGSEADLLGVGAQCSGADECDDDPNEQACRTEFKGGYCGVVGCAEDVDCPEDSACVAHTDGQRYCFRLCADKAECNANRDVDNEANCSSSVDFVEYSGSLKACVPPSAG
jgi:hypothetical protein